MPSATNRMPWTVRFFRRHRDDDPAESFPGLVFLASSPDKVRRTLLSILQAVATAPPPSFSGGGMWEAMHGETAGYFRSSRSRSGSPPLPALLPVGTRGAGSRSPRG